MHPKIAWAGDKTVTRERAGLQKLVLVARVGWTWQDEVTEWRGATRSSIEDAPPAQKTMD